MALAREWDELVAQVRELDGFEGFLRPLRLETLLPAAEGGPVVMVNASRWRCDALIVRQDGVARRELPGLTLREATRRANVYLTVLHAAELADLQYLGSQQSHVEEVSRGGVRRRLHSSRALELAYQQVDGTLAELQGWMWDVVAEPVLDELGYTDTPGGDASTWPRVWWCPTGPLAVLPLHTAGRHGEQAGGHTVLDRVVSSYTPTLRALLEARRPDEERDAADRTLDRLLFIDVPDLPGLAPIDNAAERSALLQTLPEDRRTVLKTAQATRAAVRTALPNYRWAHFSCHGDQDLKHPSEGGLRLCDGILTVADISSDRFRGDFVGLSACKTGVGGVDLLDEVVTLAAALHYTGYRHVIAALWSVDNYASAEVFSGLYRSIAAHGRLEPDRAPVALHKVIRQMRDRQPHWPHRWTPFTHTGP
jgi:hypothetical protein